MERRYISSSARTEILPEGNDDQTRASLQNRRVRFVPGEYSLPFNSSTNFKVFLTVLDGVGMSQIGPTILVTIHRRVGRPNPSPRAAPYGPSFDSTFRLISLRADGPRGDLLPEETAAPPWTLFPNCVDRPTYFPVFSRIRIQPNVYARNCTSSVEGHIARATNDLRRTHRLQRWKKS